MPAAARVTIVGAGTIGVGWAIVFARAGIGVALHDTDGARLGAARSDLDRRLQSLSLGGLLEEPPHVVAGRIRSCETLEAALEGATHVQENAPERLALKRELFRRLDGLTEGHVTLASSSSALTASTFAEELSGRARCLVAHPANPPYLLPVVELVPAPFTDPDVLERSRRLFAAAGMSTVVVRREVEGFVLNRLQGALLREAYCLVRDGVASVDDVDRVVRDGVGRRWSVVGPFETAELNTRGGIEAHALTMGPAYARMGAERGQHDPWTPELVERVAGELHRRVPRQAWEEHVARRDDALIALERARRASGLFDNAQARGLTGPLIP